MRTWAYLLAALFLLAGSNVALNSESSGEVILGPVSMEPFTGPILILGDDQFDHNAAALGWNGTGSDYDPYIIENLNIAANGSGYGIGIKTNYSFIIRNCTIGGANGGGAPLGAISVLEGNATIHNNTVMSSGYGIRIYGLSAVVINNTATSCNMGLWMVGNNMTVTGNNASSNANRGIHFQGDHSLIKDNYISDNDFGIHATGANNNRFENNTLVKNDDHGIRLDFADNNVIIGNYASENDDGIYINYDSDNNLIVENEIWLCEEAINIQDGRNNTFFSNEMYGCSFFFKTDIEPISSQVIPLNNTVWGDPVYYFIGEENNGISFENIYAGQIITADISGINISNVRTSSGTIGLLIFQCSDIIITGGQNLGHVYHGIFLKNCLQVKIEYSEISGNDVGITFSSSNSILIDNCTFRDNRESISSVYSVDVMVMNNTIEYGDEGMIIDHSSGKIVVASNILDDQYGTSIFSDHSGCKIERNTISSRLRGSTGIQVQNRPCRIEKNSITGFEKGISIIRCDFNLIYGNNLIRSMNSIVVDGGEENVIHNNSIEDSFEYGIKLQSTDLAKVIGNTMDGGSSGILISGSARASLTNNEMINCSIEIFYTESDVLPINTILGSNTVDGKPVYYYENLDLQQTSIPDDGGQYIFLRSTGSLSDIEMDSGNRMIQLVLVDHFRMDNLSFSKDGWINGKRTGIRVLYSEDISISNSTFEHLDIGLDQEFTSGINITDCIFKYIGSSGIRSKQGQLEVRGSRFDDCEVGISFLPGQRSIVEGNYFEYCGTGVHIDSTSRGIMVSNNIFFWNREFGVNITEGAFNEISNNAFHSNGMGHIFIDTKENGVMNNYYEDFDRPDLDDDGIVDLAFVNISGKGNASDAQPLAWLPEEILPAPERVDDVQHLDAIILSWEQEEPQFIDVLNYTITRTGVGEESSVFEIDDTMRGFIDSNIKNDTDYVYQVQAGSFLGPSGPEFFSQSIDVSPFFVHFYQENGLGFKSRNVTLSWHTDASISEIQEQRLIIDGVSTVIPPGVTEHKVEFDEMGWHEASIHLRDARGFTASSNISFLVDWQDPWIRLYGNDLRFNETVDIHFNITDNIAIHKMYYRVFYLSIMTLEEALVFRDDHTFGLDTRIDLPLTRSGAVPPPPLEIQTVLEGTLTPGQTLLEFDVDEGNYTIVIYGEDLAGNIVGKFHGFGVDKTPPLIISKTPRGRIVPVDAAVIVELTEEIDNDTIILEINGIPGNWMRINETVYQFKPHEDLDHYTQYLAQFEGKDLFGNQVSVSWTFGTMKDPKKRTTVTGRLVGSDGLPVVNASVSIANLSELSDIFTDEEGYFTFDIGEGNYTVLFIHGEYGNRSVDITVPYTGGPIDLGEISLQNLKEKEERIEFPWLVVIAGIALIIVTIYFAITSFTRKGGPLPEE